MNIEISQHLNRLYKISDLILIAKMKRDLIVTSPYYKIFGRYGEREDDLIQSEMVILRLQTWLCQAKQKARQCRI